MSLRVRLVWIGLVAAAVPALHGCRDAGELRAEVAERGESPRQSRRVGVIAGFHGPESVRYDPETDAYYVSNIYLYGSWKDNNGYIARIDAGDPRKGRILAQGGVNGVTLHAPKGVAIHGDTVWVADIDVLRGFDRTNGAPLGTIDLTPYNPTLLNDVVVGPDGTIRVTDTGIVMADDGVIADTTGDRIFIIGPNRSVSAIAAGSPYPKPNGIAWDAKSSRWLVATFDQFSSKLYAIPEGSTTRTVLASGKGHWDGVEVLDDGRILVSSWSDSSVYVVDGSRAKQIVRHLATPADIGVDTKRNRVAVPSVRLGRVELWTIPKR